VSFWIELKRRNVFRVGAAYAVGAWFVLQLLDVVGEILELPAWAGKLVLVLVVLGFFLSLFFAWAFELTPEGIKRDHEIDRSRAIAPATGRRLDRIIIALLALAVALLLFDELYLEPRQTEGAAPAGAASAAVDATATSIAVLPFEDLSEAGDQGWFADGLAEEILNSLARIPELQVSARAASFRYRDSDLPLSAIAGELGVGYMLAGSVRSTRERIRVTVQLNRASSGVQVWSETYDRDPADLISLQEDLAVSIAEALQISLDPNALAAMVAAGTRSTEAYRLYLRGLALAGGASTRPREDVMPEVRALYEQAVAVDPQFADAWYQLASWWQADMMPNNLYGNLSGFSTESAMQAFERAIDKAIEHAADRVDQDGYRAVKADVAGRLREAVERYDAFVTARPNNYAGWDGLLFAAMKASDSAQVRRSLAWLRERGRQELFSAFVYVGNAYQYEDPSRVAGYGLERLEEWPESQILAYQTHRALLWAGRTGEAAELVRRIDDGWGGKSPALLRQACAEGRQADAEALYDRHPADEKHLRWIELKILGREEAAKRAVDATLKSDIPFQRTAFLDYRVFDPTPHPVLVDLLKREGVARPPAIEIPFRCREAAAEGPETAVGMSLP
jgi:TolB-like protein